MSRFEIPDGVHCVEETRIGNGPEAGPVICTTVAVAAEPERSLPSTTAGADPDVFTPNVIAVVPMVGLAAPLYNQIVFAFAVPDVIAIVSPTMKSPEALASLERVHEPDPVT